MAVTVGGTSITFNDATVQTTAAGGVPAIQAVGTYAFLWWSGTRTSAIIGSNGDTLAGSTLVWSGIPSGGVPGASAPNPPGTWRICGYFANTWSSPSTLFIRIA